LRPAVDGELDRRDAPPVDLSGIVVISDAAIVTP
jgi:hypothetical protein